MGEEWKGACSLICTSPTVQLLGDVHVSSEMGKIESGKLGGGGVWSLCRGAGAGFGFWMLQEVLRRVLSSEGEKGGR